MSRDYPLGNARFLWSKDFCEILLQNPIDKQTQWVLPSIVNFQTQPWSLQIVVFNALYNDLYF